jgi:MinD-like ATPase involved in chromosome partitioning or flagellar assembly
MGADDVWPHDAAPAEFLRKLVLLSRKVQKAKSGKLIVVDGGKGGVGVTSVAAGVAEALFAAGKRVLLVDLDSQTQDLSRFLQTKPFVNENLQLLLEQGRPVTQESVEQATAPIWQGESGFSCMTPVSEQEGLLDPRSSFPRVFMNVLEVVDSLYDCVVVDLASTQGALLRTLYRVADRVVFVVNGDPAALYSSVDRLSRIRGAIAPDTQILVVENGTARAGLSHALLHQEFCRAARLSPEEWLEGGLPYCRQGARWPASGGTLTSLASAGLRSAMNRLLVSLQLIEGGASDRSSRAIDYVQTLFANLRGSLGSKKAGAPLPAGAPQLALPTKAGVSTIGDQPLATPAVSARGTLLTTGRPPSEEVRIAPSVRAPLLKLNPPRRGESSTESQPLDGRKLVSGAKFS